MLLAAHSAGQRVLLTFMSKGASGAGGIQVDMPEDDSVGESLDGEEFPVQSKSISAAAPR